MAAHHHRLSLRYVILMYEIPYNILTFNERDIFLIQKLLTTHQEGSVDGDGNDVVHPTGVTCEPVHHLP